MNLYAHDLSLFDFNYSDPNIDSLYHHTSQVSSSTDSITTTLHVVDDDDDDDQPPPRRNHSSPPKHHRHDGTSPLPLGMDWSLPPPKWDGRNTVWPHNPHGGWSFCVTVPSWFILPRSRSSVPVTLYRIQIGIQTSEGITTTQGISRRFSDFLKLYSDLKKAFPKKALPTPPPKRLLRTKSPLQVEERRCSLEDWMEKMLSDIDISRSAQVATFLELEAAARSAFHVANQTTSDVNSSASGVACSFAFQPNSDLYVTAGASSVASDYGEDSLYEISELGTPTHGRDIYCENAMESFSSDQSLFDSLKTSVKYGMLNWYVRQKRQGEEESKIVDKDEITEHDTHVRRLSTESVATDVCSIRTTDIENLRRMNSLGNGLLDFPECEEAPKIVDSSGSSGLQLRRDIAIVLPSDERQKFNRVLSTMQRRLGTAKTDMEDLIARLNQELAVREYLTTKVKDLEVELETTTVNSKENIQQSVLNERERFTQMQWDMEELRSKCLEMDIKSKAAQDEKVHAEATKHSLVKENEMLIRDMDVAREQMENMRRHTEEIELKAKADVKILVKEVKSLRSSQSELKQELSRLMKEKLEVERLFQKEKRRREQVNAVNAKLLHESEILCDRLQECSVNFLIEDDDKLVMDTPSSSDAIDMLTTSENRIGLLLAEAQLLAQDVETAAAIASGDKTNNDNTDTRADDQLRKKLTDILVDNATLRKQVNSVLRCVLSSTEKSDKDEDEDEDEDGEKEAAAPPRKTVLSSFWSNDK